MKKETAKDKKRKKAAMDYTVWNNNKAMKRSSAAGRSKK